MAQNGLKAFLQSRRWSDELGPSSLITLWGIISCQTLDHGKSWKPLSRGTMPPGKGSKPPNTSGSSTWVSVRAMPKGPRGEKRPADNAHHGHPASGMHETRRGPTEWFRPLFRRVAGWISANVGN